MLKTPNSKVRALLLLAAAALSLGLGGCMATVGPGVRHSNHLDLYYDYYYYPTLDIYRDIASGHYWYHDHDHWTRVRHLPRHFHPRENERVFLRLDTDTPHRYHKQHRERYAAPYGSPQRESRHEHAGSLAGGPAHRRLDRAQDDRARDANYRVLHAVERDRERQTTSRRFDDRKSRPGRDRQHTRAVTRDTTSAPLQRRDRRDDARRMNGLQRPDTGRRTPAAAPQRRAADRHGHAAALRPRASDQAATRQESAPSRRPAQAARGTRRTERRSDHAAVSASGPGKQRDEPRKRRRGQADGRRGGDTQGSRRLDDRRWNGAPRRRLAGDG